MVVYIPLEHHIHITQRWVFTFFLGTNHAQYGLTYGDSSHKEQYIFQFRPGCFEFNTRPRSLPKSQPPSLLCDEIRELWDLVHHTRNTGEREDTDIQTLLLTHGPLSFCLLPVVNVLFLHPLQSIFVVFVLTFTTSRMPNSKSFISPVELCFFFQLSTMVAVLHFLFLKKTQATQHLNMLRLIKI